MSELEQDCELEEPWGLLVTKNSGEEEERIPIIGKIFTIGRNKDANRVISGNKFVSGIHCSLSRDELGKVWFEDTSTNGTLVDGRKVHRSQTQVADGMMIKVVFRKDDPKLNLCYQFNDLRGSSDRVSQKDSQDSNATLEMTLEYDDEGEPSLKRKCTSEHAREPEPKKLALIACDSSTVDTTAVHTTDQVGHGTNDLKKEETAPGSTPVEPSDDGSTKLVSSKEESCEVISERGGEAEKISDTSKETSAVPTLDKKDSIEETLICQICQEILHDCVSLQPCMHSYCGGCYSDWMKYSRECPACRNPVDRVSKNHIVNNLVDAYLRVHPEKKRPEEDLKELDEKNKIAKDMLYPKKKKLRSYDEDDDYDEEEEDYSSDSSSTSDYTTSSSSKTKPLPFPFGSSAFGLSSSFAPPFIPSPTSFASPIPVSCRQCPSHTSTFTGTSTFVCSPSTNHILCNCCLQPMPDRRTDSDLTIPPQKCDVCGKAYCHMYWGCGKFGCRGCLNFFKDVDFDSGILDYVINDNHFESEVLKKYLSDKSLTVKDLLKDCLAKLDSGTYTSSDTRTSRISSSTRTCYQCALKNFKDLAYQYREEISSEELPGEVLKRVDCYYGKNCRTQRHNRDHCKKYNHVCEQKRY